MRSRDGGRRARGPDATLDINPLQAASRVLLPTSPSIAEQPLTQSDDPVINRILLKNTSNGDSQRQLWPRGQGSSPARISSSDSTSNGYPTALTRASVSAVAALSVTGPSPFTQGLPGLASVGSMSRGRERAHTAEGEARVKADVEKSVWGNGDESEPLLPPDSGSMATAQPVGGLLTATTGARAGVERRRRSRSLRLGRQGSWHSARRGVGRRSRRSSVVGPAGEGAEAQWRANGDASARATEPAEPEGRPVPSGDGGTTAGASSSAGTSSVDWAAMERRWGLDVREGIPLGGRDEWEGSGDGESGGGGGSAGIEPVGARAWLLALSAVLTGIMTVAALAVLALWAASLPSRGSRGALLDGDDAVVEEGVMSVWAGRVWGCGRMGEPVAGQPRWTQEWLHESHEGCGRGGGGGSLNDHKSSDKPAIPDRLVVAVGDWGEPSPAQAATARDIAQMLHADANARKRAESEAAHRSTARGSAAGSSGAGAGAWQGMFTTARVSLSLGDHRYPGGVQSWTDTRVTEMARQYRTHADTSTDGRDTKRAVGTAAEAEDAAEEGGRVVWLGVLGNHDYYASSPLPALKQARARPFIPMPYYAVDTPVTLANHSRADARAEPYGAPWQRWLQLDTTALVCAEQQWAAANLDEALAHERRARRAGFAGDEGRTGVKWSVRPPAPWSAYGSTAATWRAFEAYREALAEAVQSSSSSAADAVTRWVAGAWTRARTGIGGAVDAGTGAEGSDAGTAAGVLMAETEAEWNAAMTAAGVTTLRGYEVEDCARVQAALTASTVLEVVWESVCAGAPLTDAYAAVPGEEVGSGGTSVQLPNWLQWLHRKSPSAGRVEPPAACALRGGAGVRLRALDAGDVSALVRVGIVVVAGALGEGDGRVAWRQALAEAGEVAGRMAEVNAREEWTEHGWAGLVELANAPATAQRCVGHWWGPAWVWAAALLADTDAQAVAWVAEAYGHIRAAAEASTTRSADAVRCVLAHVRQSENVHDGCSEWRLRTRGGVGKWTLGVAQSCQVCPEAVISLAAMRGTAAATGGTCTTIQGQRNPLAAMPVWLGARVRVGGVRRQVLWAEMMAGARAEESREGEAGHARDADTRADARADAGAMVRWIGGCGSDIWSEVQGWPPCEEEEAYEEADESEEERGASAADGGGEEDASEAAAEDGSSAAHGRGRRERDDESRANARAGSGTGTGGNAAEVVENALRAGVDVDVSLATLSHADSRTRTSLSPNTRSQPHGLVRGRREGYAETYIEGDEDGGGSSEHAWPLEGRVVAALVMHTTHTSAGRPRAHTARLHERPRTPTRLALVAHHPPLSLGPHRSHLQLVALLEEVLAQRALRLWVAGHDHLLAHVAIARWCSDRAANGTRVRRPCSWGTVADITAATAASRNAGVASPTALLGTDPLHVVVSGGGGWRPNRLMVLPLSLPQPTPDPALAAAAAPVTLPVLDAALAVHAAHPRVPTAGTNGAWAVAARAWSLQALQTCGADSELALRPVGTGAPASKYNCTPGQLLLPPLVAPLAAAEMAAGAWWGVNSMQGEVELSPAWPLVTANAADMAEVQRAVRALVALGQEEDDEGSGEGDDGAAARSARAEWNGWGHWAMGSGRARGSTTARQSEGNVPLGLMKAVAETTGYAVLRMSAEGIVVGLVASGFREDQRYTKSFDNHVKPQRGKDGGRIIHEFYIPFNSACKPQSQDQ